MLVGWLAKIRRNLYDGRTEAADRTVTEAHAGFIIWLMTNACAPTNPYSLVTQQPLRSSRVTFGEMEVWAQRPMAVYTCKKC